MRPTAALARGRQALTTHRRPQVELLRFPHPYRAALALSNDAEFMTPRAFWDLHRFLNTSAETRLGPGLGLPITDSLFMYSVDERRSFSYFDATSTRPSRHAWWLRDLVAAGVIDVLHAFGDFDGVGGCTRPHAAAALDELSRQDLRLEVWSNHGSAENTQNIGGSHATYQRGDLPGADEYHSDLTTQYGVRYCWLDFNATNEVPQDPRPTRFGRVHGEPLLEDETLRDGARVRLFRRYRGPNRPDPATLAAQLSERHLELLQEREGAMIVYQHLGCDRSSGECVTNEYPYLPDAAVRALRRVASLRDEGRIWVTGVQRLLRYRDVQASLRWRTRAVGEGAVEVAIESRCDRRDLAGLTFASRHAKVIHVVDADGRAVGVDVETSRERVSVTVPVVEPELPPTPAAHELDAA